MNITKENIDNSKKLTKSEKQVLNKMLYWEKWHRSKGHKEDDIFIITNESGLIEMDANNLFLAINHLVALGILKKRNCDATAYEWDSKEALEHFLEEM